MLFLKTFKDVKISWKHTDKQTDGRGQLLYFARQRQQPVGLYSVEPYTQS